MNAQLDARMQGGEEEYINVLKSKVDYCKAAHKRDPDNDSALVEWGCTLTYLAMAEGDIKRKKEMLRESRDKLNKAMKINPDAMTSNGDYAIFQVSCDLAVYGCLHACLLLLLARQCLLHQLPVRGGRQAG